jgi:hypothetical protein
VVGEASRSFSWSFHWPLLGPTGAPWLDDIPDLSCQDSTQEHPVDDPLLSGKQQVEGSSPPPAHRTAAPLCAEAPPRSGVVEVGATIACTITLDDVVQQVTAVVKDLDATVAIRS